MIIIIIIIRIINARANLTYAVHNAERTCQIIMSIQSRRSIRTNAHVKSSCQYNMVARYARDHASGRKEEGGGGEGGRRREKEGEGGRRREKVEGIGSRVEGRG